MSNAPVAFTLPVVLLLLVLAGLGYVTARRGWAGTLRRDGRLGIRSKAASSSDDAFAVANRVAAPVVGGAAAIALVLAVLVTVLHLPTAGSVVIGVLGLLGVLVLMVAGGVLGEQAARTLPVPARRPRPSAACSGCACGSGGCAGLTRTAAPGTAV
ncbi:SdpI family protein [Nakamurella panacisegetis]|uniref:SdpI family protein n=1 Tax=Nakamurella panacisegetis TaxID=1090615 RepID=UPI000B89A086|nr:SdpI family protein [Nakamurella panacisegetis]